MASNLLPSLIEDHRTLCVLHLIHERVARFFTGTDSMETLIFLWNLLTDYRFHNSGYSSQNSGFLSGSLNSNAAEIRKNSLQVA